MANRKVLINYHTSGSGAPQANQVYLGELVVAHETGKETIWTKNNANEMVPFISCAQTISIIDSKIQTSDADVQKAEGEAHLNITTGDTPYENHFTINTVDVQSEEEFKAYSARTNNALTALTKSFGDLLDIALIDGSGDTIITVSTASTDVSANTFTVTHKQALATDGFKKLTTDAYGHVTAATPVATADIEALGFKTSADTDAEIAELSGATQAISGYAATQISQLSAGTQHDIETLSGDVVEYIKVVSGNIETVINELSAGTAADIEKLSAGTIADNNTLSADVVTYINTISGYAHGEIVELSGAVQANETDIDNLSAATLDLSAVTLTGVSLNNTPLAVSNHIVSVPVTTSGSGIANATESGSVADALAVKEYVQNTVSSAVEYKGATNGEPAGTPVVGDLWIASSAFTVDGKNVEVGDFIIYNGEGWEVIEKNLDGAITGSLTQDTVTLGDSTNSVKSLANGTSGQVLTIANGVPTWVDDPELSVVSAGTGNVLTNITVDDHEITFTKGITAASDADLQALSGAVKDFSGATDAKFIELSAYTKDVDDKVKALSAGTIQLSADTKAAIEQLSGFAHNSMIARDDAVFSSAKTYTDEKVAAEIALLDSSTAVTAGKYITGIAIADGKISGITEESLPANVPITATTGAAVDTPSAVLTGVTADGTDNHNLTFGMSNKVFSAATSDSALTSESALTAVHADAATKVDSALTISIIDSAGTTATTVFDGSANQTITITNTDTATTEAGHYTPATAASAFTAPAGSFLSAVSVDSKNHVLEVAYADKVNSATTSESADTAAQVAQSLTMTDGTNTQTYNGSEAKSLTFGTDTAAGKSMSMTSAGLVDVEIIDCGTY